MGTVFRMGRILLLVISTALAAPQGNYSDITMDELILERSAINTCGCAPVSSTNRIVGGKEVNPKGKLPYQVMFYPCMGPGGPVWPLRRNHRQQEVCPHRRSLLG